MDDLERGREWRRSHQERCDFLNQRRYLRNREAIIAQNGRWNKENPEKHRVRQVVYLGIKEGKLKRPEVCSLCNTVSKVQAHHEDYSKPLEITWLCRSCHKRFHAGTLGVELTRVK